MSLVLFVDCETLITRQGVPRGPVYNFLIEIIIYQKAFLPAASPSRGLNWQTHCYNWEGKSYPKSEFLVTPIALPGIYFSPPNFPILVIVTLRIFHRNDPVATKCLLSTFFSASAACTLLGICYPGLISVELKY